MALTNSQYDEIMRDYYAQQFENRHALDARIAEVYLAIPEYKELSDSVGSITVMSMKAGIRKDVEAKAQLSDRIANIEKQMADLLLAHGFEPDYLKMTYRCPSCKDTGFISNEKCHCFKQAEIQLLYHQSNVSELIKKDNFDTFSYDYYSDQAIVPDTKLTHRAYMKQVVDQLMHFVDEFPQGRNLLLLGNPGVGKTFLSNCIAKELLDRSHSVLYLSANELFSSFSYQHGDEDGPGEDLILTCELLIIDDLGTELTNSFTNSKLFQCVNDRLLRERSTIISTNLSLEDLMNRYSERIFSRVLSSYQPYRLVGDDIRLLKK